MTTEDKLYIVQFLGWSCIVQKMEYGNGRTALQLVDKDDYAPVATASVNLPQEPLAKDEIAIKDYSENKGMLDALVKGGIVSEPIGYANSGFVTIPICKLLI